MWALKNKMKKLDIRQTCWNQMRLHLLASIKKVNKKMYLFIEIQI